MVQQVPNRNGFHAALPSQITTALTVASSGFCEPTGADSAGLAAEAAELAQAAIGLEGEGTGGRSGVAAEEDREEAAALYRRASILLEKAAAAGSEWGRHFL